MGGPRVVKKLVLAEDGASSAAAALFLVIQQAQRHTFLYETLFEPTCRIIDYYLRLTM